ncbi:MAG: amidohydrolase [Halioglobus sp.]
MSLRTFSTLWFFALVLTGGTRAADPVDSPLSPITVYVAKKIITMEPALPEATAVAVADGRVVAVGSLKDMDDWLARRGGRVDKTFRDKILMPGFIDPHVHPSLPAVLTQFPFLAPDDWHLPTGDFPGAKTPDEYRTMLKAQVERHFEQGLVEAGTPFISWGYHQLWHGEVRREQLNEWFPDRPVMLWHRSFHEIIANDTAFKLLGVTEAVFEGSHEVNWAQGHVWENGLVALVPKMPFLLRPDRYQAGLSNFIEMMHEAGVTSAMDMGVGIFGDPVGETQLISKVMNESHAPARLVLTPIITDFMARGVSPADALAQVESWSEYNSERVMFDDHFKLMIDGAIYSGLSQYAFPGYKDGHEGQWMAPLEVTYEWAETFWNAGYQLHAHTNGDASAAALIDMVRRLQEQKPRIDHRLTLEHFAYATEDQLRQMHALGMQVSANPYYQYILADVYTDEWLGADRARNMVPLGAVRRQGMRFGLHSDCPMAPLSPLTLAWSAVNRDTINGNVNASTQKVSLEDALRGITIDAAWLMRMEDEIGSIRAGKRADFAVLEDDPLKVNPRRLKDIAVWGTVFAGDVRPVESLLGADADTHDCRASAGYQWCAKTNACERAWELAAKQGFHASPEGFIEWCGK